MLPIGDKSSGEIPSEEIQFLKELDGIKKKTEALDLISREDVIYHKCLSLIMNNKNFVKDHHKDIENIINKIINLKSEIHDPDELRVLKICSDNNIITKHLLHSAIQQGHYNIVKALLESGVDPNAKDNKHMRPFLYLFRSKIPAEKQQELAQIFLQNPNFDLQLNLESAFTKQNYVAIGILIEHGASTDSQVADVFPQAYGNFSCDNQDLFKEDSKLLKIFKSFPLLNGADEKTIIALYKVWMDPVNSSNVLCGEEMRLAANFLSRQPSFGIDSPNLTTVLLKLIMRDPSLHLIAPCLDAMPWLITKEQGEDLMSEAITNDNRTAVKAFLDRGFDVWKSTAWWSAIYDNRCEIAELMLRSGISDDIKNQQMQKAMAQLLEEPACWNSHKETLSLLIANGADVELVNQLGKSLLSCIVDIPDIRNYENIITTNRPWPITFELLKRGASLSQQEHWKLFEQAIDDNQLSAASLLSARLLSSLKTQSAESLFKTLNVDLLAKIIKLRNQSWVQAILSEWVAAGLNLNEYVTQTPTDYNPKGTSLLHFVIGQKRNYALGAFLISLGANLDLPDSNGLTSRQILEKQKIDPADLMTYVTALKQGPPALQKLRRELFLTNMGHLLADDFLEKMTDALGEKLEGNLFSYSLAFMVKILNYVLERHGKKFTPEQLNKIEILVRQMQTAQSLAIQIDDIREMNSDNPFLTTALQHLASSVKNQLKELPVDETLWLPYGWIGAKGHATMIGCQKTKEGWKFMVVNTGEGLQYHEREHDSLRPHADIVRTFEIPQEAIDDGILLQQIFEPGILGKSTNYGAKDIYAIFQSFATGSSKEELPSAWMREQLSGTCSFRCLLAAALMTIGRDAYKVLSPLAKREVTEIGFEQHIGLIKHDPALAKLFFEVIPRLSGQVTKNINQKSPSMEVEFLGRQKRRLEKLEKMQQSLQASLPPQRSEIAAIQYNENIPTVTTDVKESILNAEKISTPPPADKGEMKELEALPLIKPKMITSGKELSTALTNFNDYLLSLPIKDRESKETEVAICQFLTTLSKVLIDGKGQPQTGILEDIANNPVKCQEAIDLLQSISLKLCDCKEKRFDDGTKTIAYCSALSIGWLLGQIIDKTKEYPSQGQLSHYALPIGLLSPLLSKDPPPMLDPEAISDLMRLYKFFKGTKSENRKELFTFDHFFRNKNPKDPDRGIRNELRRDTTEYAYATGHVHALPFYEKDKAKRTYTEAKRNYESYKTDFDENEWLANYCYANHLLPKHFCCLQKLALMARMESPFANSPDKKSTLIREIDAMRLWIGHGPFLIPRYNTDILAITYLFEPAPYLDNVNSKSSSLSLPKKNDGASFEWGERSSTVDYAYLKPISQNMVVTQTELRFHGLLSLRSPCLKKTKLNAAIALTMLLDYFGMNIDELTKQDARIVFATTLMGNSKRLDALKAKPGLADEFLAFFDHAIDHFKTQVQGNVQKEGSLQAALFLIEQKQRLLRQIELQGLKTSATRDQSLESVRREIREWRATPECRNPAEQQYLCMMLLDSYHAKQKLEPDQIKEIIALRAELTCMLQSLSENSLIFPHLRNSAERAILKHHAEIKAYLNANEKERNQLCSDVLKIYKIENCTGEWKEAAFPCYVLKASDGSTYRVDILNGIILKNGQSLAALADIKGSQLFKELFADQQLIGTQQEGYIDSQDAQGKGIRFYTSKSYRGIELESVQRQIDGEWYKYIPLTSANRPLLPPLPDLGNLQIFQKVGTAKPEYLIVDKRTLSPKYHLDAEGCFSFPVGPNAKRYEWCDVGKTEEGYGLKGFDPDAILWKPAPLNKDDHYPPLLISPHYHDEQGNLIAFAFVEGKWEWQASKHLHIASQQLINGISGLKRYLVLENDEGEKEVLFPKQTVTQLEQDKSFPSICERMKLEKDKPVSRVPTKNAYLAYLALSHAVTAADYAVAMDYLKQAFRFEAYSGEDLRLLGCIFNLSSENHDHSGSMDAVRLYAAWLVHDNLKRNPPQVKPLAAGQPETKPRKGKPGLDLPGKFDSPEKDWQAYWKNEWKWTSKKIGNPTRDMNFQVSKLMSHYLARRKNVSYSVQLENVVDAQELVNWGLERRTQASRELPSIAKLPRPKAEIYNLDRIRGIGEYQRNPVKKVAQVFYTRPGENFYKSFNRLYRAAKSSDVQERNKVQQILNGMSYDNTESNSGLRAIIQAALVVSDYATSSPKYSKEVYLAAVEIVNYVDQEIHPGEYEDYNKHSMSNKLNRMLDNFLETSHEASHVEPAMHETRPKTIPLKEIIPPHSPHVLPSTPPEQPMMSFEPTVGIEKFKTLYDHYFDLLQIPVVVGQQEHFDLKTEDPFLQKSIEELNSDLLTGTKNNQAIPKHDVKDKTTLPETVKTLRSELEKQHKIEAGLLDAKRQKMLDLARQLPEDLEKQLLQKAAILGGKKAPLDEGDCIALFLQGDPAEFRRLTNLTSDAQIQELYQLIGDYLLLSHKVGHIEKVQGDVAKLDKLLQSKMPSEVEKAALLQKIGEGLAVTEQVVLAKDPAAFIILEQGLNLYMKKDQVEGLREMLTKAEGDHTRFRSIFLQRIQGGGKTLIFGPTLALLKADGYHLSIHVPATAQYSTALYDMHHQSGKIFGQKERTLEFDDDPQRYTVEYLTWMLDTIDKAVVDREFINMTKETLRAMRCKYVKMRLIINDKLRSSNGIETPEIADLELKNALLKEMLKIMRERGVFTFDEVHLATDPTKELNMPFGKCTSVLGTEAKMIGKMLQLAATVKNQKGLLLKLCENHQSQQTEEEYAEMVVAVADRLVKDPWVQTYLKQLKEGNEEITQSDLEEVKDYFLGIRENIPDFIHKKLEAANERLANDPTSIELKAQTGAIKEAAELIVLAKQMLDGEWMKNRLDKSVDVHQGFSGLGNGPRVAIPFIANNVAAEGSEFSDRYVMMINTLMSYAVKGLSPVQTVDFIKQLRKAASLERESQQDENPNFTLKDTTASKKFQALCNNDLFLVDVENPETIETVRKALLAGTEQALEAMFEYAIASELPKVEIYDFQVCSHGQNTLSMGQSSIGYSGSIDNEHMAPPGMEIQPEPGTNGQTIDLFVRENDEVWIINPAKPGQETDSLFTDLIAKHPEKASIRAIIDVGSHFKGISNDDVAVMTCRFLQKENSAIEGVLSFDPQSGKLMFRHKNQPDHAIALSGTRPDIIKKETGYDPDQLFTYYDQDHITGIDIAQFIDTKAVITWSEHTKIHEALQGGRRLRELNLAQRLISATEPGVVDKIDAKLNRKSGELPVGKVSGGQLGIKELILFAHLNEAESQREENMLFCLQKMENVLQQSILDRGFDIKCTVEEERELFKSGEHLFSKSIATDLYFEYAFKRKTIPIEDFLANLLHRMMQPLEKTLKPEEYRKLEDEIIDIINAAVDTLKPSMDVSPLAEKSPVVSASSVNPEGTMIQFRQQEGQKQQDNQKQQENQAVQQKLSEVDRNVFKTHKPAAEIRFAQNVFANPKFGIKVQEYTGANPCISELPPNIITSDDEYEYRNREKGTETNPKEPAAAEVWSLNQVIAKEMGDEYQGLFDDHLLVTSNFAVCWAKRIDLTGAFRKEAFQWLMICDEKEGKKDWKLMLISVQDAIDFHVMLDQAAKNGTPLPEGRKILLLRPGFDIKFLREDKDFDLKELETDPAKKLMAQAMLFAGKLQTLNRKKWNNTLDKALPKGDERKRHCKFFEEKIISAASPEYQSSKVRDLLHA